MCATRCLRVAIALKRKHDHSNSYTGRNIKLVLAYRLARYHHDRKTTWFWRGSREFWISMGRHRHRDWATEPGLSTWNLKVHSQWHFLQQGDIPFKQYYYLWTFGGPSSFSPPQPGWPQTPRLLPWPLKYLGLQMCAGPLYISCSRKLFLTFWPWEHSGDSLRLLNFHFEIIAGSHICCSISLFSVPS